MAENKTWEHEAGRWGATLLDPFAQLALGVSDALEGVVDLGLGAVGAVGGIFSEDFRDTMQDAVEYDFTGEHLEKPMDEAGLSYSYLNDNAAGEITQEVFRAVGNMLPAVAVSVATAGAAAPAMGVKAAQAAGQTAGLVTLGASAAGGGTEEAYRDGAGYYEGLGYGAASGAVEVVTEKLFGGVTGKVFGAGMLDNVAGSVAKTGARRVLTNMGEEAIEEAAATFVNPALKSIYKGRDAWGEYFDPALYKDVGRSALVGGLTSAVYGGTMGRMMHTSGKDADISDSMEEIDGLRRKQMNLWASDSLSDTARAQLLAATEGNLANVETALQKASPKERARLIERHNLSGLVDGNGKLRPNAAAKLINEPIDVETEGSRDAGASFDRRYMSPGLWNRRADVQTELDQINADLRQKYGFEAPEGDATSIDNTAAVQYNKKSKLINKTFPPYNESFSEANELSIRWAKQEQVRDGAQKLISHGGKWYLIEKYSDMDLGYLIVDQISKRDYDKIARRIKNAEGDIADGGERVYTYAGSIDRGLGLYASGRGGQGAYRDASSEGRADLRVSRLVETGSAGESNQNQRTGNHGESTGDQQGRVKYSRKPIPAGVDNTAMVQYNRKAPWIQWKSDALAWANEVDTQVGDMKSGADDQYFYFYEAIDADHRGRSTDYKVIAKIPLKNSALINQWSEKVRRNNAENQRSLFQSISAYEFEQKRRSGDDGTLLGESARDGHDGSFHQGESGLNGESTFEAGNGNQQRSIKYSPKPAPDAAPNIEIFDGELSEHAQKNYQQMKKAFSKLSEKTPTGMNFVLIKPNENIHGAILRGGNTIYIAEDTLRDGTWAKKLVHEITHFAEGSREYNRLMKHLSKDSEVFAKALDSASGVSYSEKSENNRKPALKIQADSELAQRIAKSSKSKYTVIRDYLVEKFYGYTFTLSDGKQAIMDKRDAQELAHKADDAKSVELANLRLLIENAELYAEDHEVTHNKFDAFSYYEITVSIDNVEHNLLLNVGRSKYDGKYHIYDITKNKRTAHRSSTDVSRPVGYAIKSSSSTNSIPDSESNVKAFAEKIMSDEDSELSGELGAQMAEEVLGNEEFIGRLVMEDAPLAEKIMGKLRDLMSAFSRLNDPAARAEHKRLQKAEKLYLAAVENAGYDFIDGKIEKIKKALANDEEREDSDASRYSYEALTSKDDLNIVKLSEDIPLTEKGKMDNKAIISQGKLNAQKQKNPNNTDTDTYVYIDDIGLDVLLGAKGMQHGLARSEETALAVMKIGDILKNSVAVNELKESASRKTEMSYVLLGACQDNDNLFVVRSVVSKLLNDVTEIDVYQLNAVKGKKTETPNSALKRGAAVAEQSSLISSESPTISIADFLQVVKDIPLINEIFSNDVAKKIGVERSEGSLSGDVRYSLKNHVPSKIEAKRNFALPKKVVKEAERTEKINDLKRTIKGRDEVYRLSNRVLDLAGQIKDLKLGTYHNAAEFNDARFRGSIEQLSAIKLRGNLSVPKIRKSMSSLYDWYDPESPFFEDQKDLIRPEVREMMKSIAQGEGALTVDDLRHLVKTLEHLKHFVTTYNKVYVGGKYVDALPMARDFVDVAHRAQRMAPGWLSKLMRGKYMHLFADPASLFRAADGYDEKGFYTTMFELFRRGTLDAAVTEMELLAEYDAFLKENKKYGKRLNEDTVDYGGEKIPVGSAISLYMTSKRKQAQEGLVRSGFAVEIDGEVHRFLPIGDPETTYSEQELAQLCENLGDMLYSQFSDADKQLISIVEKAMNGKCADYKRETDLLRMGYTNIDGEGYYFPIFRNNVYKSIDNESFMEAMDRVSNLSINKDTVKGAKGELRILSVDRVFTRHVHQISIYRHLAIPTDTFNRTFNLNVGKNRGQPETVKTETANLPAYEYFQKLKADVEGVPSDPKYLQAFHSAVGRARGAYATYQLGLNPKTLVTQLASFAAAGNVLSVQSIARGIGVSAADVDEYCPLAKLRNHDNAAALAQGALEKIGRVGEVTMKPIGKVDRFVITRLFGACQVEVETKGGAKVGTKENKAAAGQLLERVILETQQNSLATERSGAMRSGDELLRSFTMFSADSMKMFGRFLDAHGEVAVLQKELKRNDLSDDTKKDLTDRLKKAQKQAVKSTVSMMSAAALMAAIAWFFNWLYGRIKDDDGDGKVTFGEQAGDLWNAFVGNMIGGLPILRDVHSYFTDGYEVESFLYSMANDMFGAVKDSYDLAEKAMQGKNVARDEVARTVRKAIYAGGQALGIPVRNVYNFSTSIIGKIFPETGYYVNNFFVASNYKADLLAAIEAEDAQRINTITGLIMDEDLGALSQNARNALRPLVEAGHDVLPRAVGDTVTYDGEEYELTRTQKKRFKEINAISFEVVEDLVKLSTFKRATEEEQARALRFVWETYRSLAIDDLLGTDSEEKKVLFAEALPIEKLAMIVAAAENIKADVDASGKAIVGTRKKKLLAYIERLRLTATEKYMVAGYLGFVNQNGRAQVEAHINKLKLSKAEKKKLLEFSGYWVA